MPYPWPSALPTVPASCCPLQHLLSVKMPVATGTRFLKSPSSEKGLAGDLSFLILPRKSSSFLSCLDYLHITSQRKDNQSGWLFSLCPKSFHIKARTCLSLRCKSVLWLSWKPLALLLKIPRERTNIYIVVPGYSVIWKGNFNSLRSICHVGGYCSSCDFLLQKLY